MGSLVESANNPAKRPAIVIDCVALINAEVSSKRGLTGVTVKAGFATIKAFKKDIVPNAMDDLLDDFSAQVDPFWIECQNQGANPRSFFQSNGVKVANALLSITDERAAQSKHKILVKAYKKLRGKAVDHIGEAMPRFADLLVKHAS